VSIEGLLLDMDGVLTTAGAALPGATQAVARLRALLPLRVLTNTTSASGATIAADLRALGFDLRDHEVLTAAMAAATYLRKAHPDARVCMLGDAVHDDLRGLRLVAADEDPDVVLIAGADASFRFENLNAVLRALLAGARLVTMHRNLSWMTDEGMKLDAGAYVLGLERASGREAVVTGKPATAFFRAGLGALGLSAAAVAMVGDDVESDVLAAQDAGLRGILVRTGKFREEGLARARGRPDHIIGAIAELPLLLERIREGG
jgi:HAD superfamily hydrolase (TIGR01458 family)